jgi:hypothetical protein
MSLPNSDNLKPKLPTDGENPDLRLENLKSNLRRAYRLVKEANKRSHLNNKWLYDRKAKQRIFQQGDIVYLYSPAKKPGKCTKFHKFWTGPFQITAKLSDLNYEITSMNHKKRVHENRLKKAYPEIWKPGPKVPKKPDGKKATKPEELEEDEIQIGSLPLLKKEQLANRLEPRTPPSQVPDTPDSTLQTTDTHTLNAETPVMNPPVHPDLDAN